MCKNNALSPSSLFALGLQVCLPGMSKSGQKSLPKVEMASVSIEREPIQCASFEHSISILHKLVAVGCGGPTCLSRGLGLKWSAFNELLASLVEGGLVRSEWSGKRRVFSPTHEGLVAVQQYLELRHYVMSGQLPALLRVPSIGVSTDPHHPIYSNVPHTSPGGHDESTAQSHPSSWRNRSGNSSSLVRPYDSISFTCQGCGGPVRLLDQELADRVRGFSVKSKHDRAFECRTCEIILFEDELTNGAFVPSRRADDLSPGPPAVFVEGSRRH